MKIIHLNDSSDLSPVSSNSAVALGNFDGMHLGHQEIIKSCVACAKGNQLTATAVTFTPHPHKVLRPQNQYQYLSTLEEKLNHMQNMGIEAAFVINFDKAFSHLSPQQFATSYLEGALKTKWLFTGYNFYFGHNREGHVAWLQKHAQQFGFQYKAIAEISDGHHTISSSNIKKLLKLGAVGIAARLLGRPFIISGAVVRGKGLGAPLLQAPTANIKIHPSFCSPAFGVYLVKVIHNGTTFYGVANIGNRPSLNEAIAEALLEVHLLDANINLYDHSLTVEFLQFLRPERKFDNIEALKAQIHMDMRVARYVSSNIASTQEVNPETLSKKIF